MKDIIQELEKLYEYFRGAQAASNDPTESTCLQTGAHRLEEIISTMKINESHECTS